MMTYSIVTLLVLAFVIALGLAIASRVFHVDENPQIAAVTDILPGANCGGCGFAGCAGYAEAVVTNPDVPANRCCVGGADTAAKIGQLTGKVADMSVPQYSFRRCSKPSGDVKERYAYLGVQTCEAVARLEKGKDRCSWGCLGLGDCTRACRFNAITVDNGVACVHTDVCTGCGACVDVCPRQVLELLPANIRVEVFCFSQDKLKAVTEVCNAGCIQCQRCIKACPAGAVTLSDGHIRINHKTCIGYGDACGMGCVKACARKVLRPIGAAMPAEQPVEANSAPDTEKEPSK